MIKVQDWIASIPDSEKHIAYVGEGKSEQREFLLCGNGWETYKNWTFHLDMAFDPTSITTHDNRQVVQTTHNSTESKEEGGTIVDEVTTKETYTVDNVQTTNHSLTDIAPLSKSIDDNGIRLSWTVLRQHTVLPGKLWATIRAVETEEQCVKKSAIMVFEVDPAICAVSAAVPPRSEFEQMETQMDALRMLTEMAAGEAERASQEAVTAADEATRSATTATSAADTALARMQTAAAAATAAAQSLDDTAAAAQQAREASAAAVAAAGDADTHRQSAASAAASAAFTAEGVNVQYENACKAVEQCSRYTLRCEVAAEKAEAAGSGGSIEYNRVNVRDYGAAGDGVTDDREAIINAFSAAKSMLPCEVYFPAGTYGISNGITVEMAYGTGGLLVRGAGRDVTTIKYLDNYDPNQPGNMWYAIRIWPVGMPGTKPATDSDYLHDISITGLTVYDTDPIAHAWNTAKGDPNKEETHGFDIQFCRHVSVTDCRIDSVGDEGIDICACHDVVVMNNHLIHSPAAGTAGGAISIGDGCKGVVISGNTVNGSAEDETLADGTVLTKRNFGIAIESLYVPVSDVVITGNTIRNVRGNGINLGATNAGSAIDRVSISGNVITDCCAGIRVMDTTNPKRDISIVNNVVVGCFGDLAADGFAIYTGTQTYSLLISGNSIRRIGGEPAVKIVTADHALVTDNRFQDIAKYALLTSGDVVVRNCSFHSIGTDGGSSQVIQKMDSATNTLTISGCYFTDIRSSVCIRNADAVENTDITFANHGTAINSKYLTRLIGGTFTNCQLTLNKDNAVMQGVSVTAATSASAAVIIAASGVSVIGCHIHVTTTKKAILENDGCVGNLVAHNVVNGKLSTAATLILADNDGTVCVNNVDLRGIIA